MSNPMLGHNKGPTLATGPAWQRHCWSIARKKLLPVLPIEVVRLRVARARELGLDYRTYAGIRATTGRDLVAFLFSTEALRLRPRTLDLPPTHAAPLQGLLAAKLALTAPDVAPHEALARLAAQGIPFAGASEAPPPLGAWSAARKALRQALDPLKLPSDAVLLIGEGSLQKDWADAARLAAFLPAETWFAGIEAAAGPAA